MNLGPDAPIAELVFDLVRDRGGSVSFAELAKQVPGFASDDPQGGLEMGYPHGENIAVWFGLSQAGADAITELMRAYRIRLDPCSPLVYAIDGMLPRVPVAKSMRAYKRTHWLPMVLNLHRPEARP